MSRAELWFTYRGDWVFGTCPLGSGALSSTKSLRKSHTKRNHRSQWALRWCNTGVNQGMLRLSQADVAGLVALISERKLLPRDGAVYLALLSFVNPVDCRVRVRARVVADRLGMGEKHVISSISRLSKVKYLYRDVNLDGEPVLLLLSPSGGPFPTFPGQVL